MSNTVKLPEVTVKLPEAPVPAILLDEGVWQAWLAKGRAQERCDYAARLRVVKWLFIAALLAAAIWLASSR
jgi:hypothetical protein